MPAGRPSGFKPEYTKMLLDYLKSDDSQVIDGKYIPGRFPSLERFACNIGVHSDSLRNWANKKDDDGELVNPEFFKAYKRAHDYQTVFINENGLAGTINPTFGIWCSKVVLGNRETDVPTTTDAQPLNISFTVEDARTRDAKS